MKKLLSLILAVVMTVSCLPLVHAEEPEIPPLETTTLTYVNPMYDGELRTVQPRTGEIYTSGTYYSSTEAAGESLKEGLKARADTIAVNFVTASLYEGKAEEMAAEMLAYACLHTGKPDEGDYLLWQYAGYNCYLDGYYENNRYYLTFTYYNTYVTTADQEAKVDAAVENLLNELNLYEASDYEKVKGVYDWMCATISPMALEDATDILSISAYGALIDRSAVYTGYSLLLYRLLLELGIDNRIIYGTKDGGEQMWNIILLEEEYYNANAFLDASLAQAGQEYQYFLRCDANFGAHQRDPIYDYEDFHVAYPMDDEDYVPGAIKVLDSGYCGNNVDEVYWKYTSDGTLTIYGAGQMNDYNVMSHRSPWSHRRDQITRIVIEEGVTRIGSDAFRNLEIAASITIPESVTAIGAYAFCNCSALTEIVLPDALTELGTGAFKECRCLKSIALPSGITVIGDYTFYECHFLTEVTVPENLQSIGAEAFYWCPITAFDIPDTVTSIGSGAFHWTDLSEVVIPDSVTYLGSSAFFGCKYLTSVKLSENLTAIEASTFAQCSKLKDITLPEKITSIGAEAFSNCNELESLILPAGLTSIDRSAFQSSGKLSLTFTGNPPAFHESAFWNYDGTVYYPADNENWTADVMQNYGNWTVTWTPYDPHTHVYATVTTAPTCTEQGYTTYTCECGDSYAADYVEALGHTYETAVTAPTCTERGFTTYTCTVCGEAHDADYVSELGHSWDVGVELASPAGCEDGRYLYTCAVCAETEERTVPAEGHEYDPETNLCIHCGAPAIQPGDANGDGCIDNVDAMLILQYAVGLIDETRLHVSVCDVNSADGIDNVDAMLVLQYAVGLITEFKKA